MEQPREITRVGVVGLGQMGSGIVEVFATKGVQVVAVELDDAALERGRERLRRSTGRAVSRGKMTQDEADAVHGAVTYACSLDGLRDVELVVEAIPEHPELKSALFSGLDQVVGDACILATNTSSLSVTDIAVGTDRPQRVVGMHFFNPAPVQRLVEVVTTVVAEPHVVATVEELARRLGKTPVVVGDRAGFVANSLLLAYLNGAVRLFEAGRVSREDLDTAMTAGCGYPMGPLALMDLIGLDTCNQVLVTMFEQTRDPLHAPAPLLSRLVAAGMLGRKSGRGFYTYDKPGSGTVVDDARTPPAAQPSSGARVTAASTELAQSLGLEQSEGGGTAVLVRAGERPVVEAAAELPDPERVVGVHVVPGTDLVEVVGTVVSTQVAVDAAASALRAAGRTVVVTTDHAGLVVDALLVPYLNDAVRLVETGYAGPDDIDTAMRNGCALPQGPCEVLDARGLADVLAAQERILEETRQAGHAPAPLLRHLVAARRTSIRDGAASGG